MIEELKDAWVSDTEMPDPKRLPTPVGWRILIRPLLPPKETKGGIIKPDSTKSDEEWTMMVGRVLALGPLAYRRTDMLGPDGESAPWCEVGNYVLYRRYGGVRIECEGVKLVLRNDDEIVAVVANPATMLG